MPRKSTSIFMAKAYCNMSLKIVSVNSGNYLGKGYQYVVSLQKQISRNLTVPHEFIVFTDDDAVYPDEVNKRPLPHDGLAGWWNKISLFKPGLFEDGDRLIYFDLDTLITDNLDWLAFYEGPHARLAPFFENVTDAFVGPQSGVMAWKGGFGAKIWESYEVTDYPQNLPGGDQRFLNKIAPNPHLLQELFPGRIVSFKGCGGVIPSRASIACFHGLPRMHQVFPEGWQDGVEIAVDDGFKKLGGYWWPVADSECWAATLSLFEEAIAALEPFLQRRGACIQAGGNVGVFPAALARLFDTVYTFEPDAVNFACLKRNIGQGNIICSRKALDNANRSCALAGNPRNIGQAHICGGGDIETCRIDDLGLDACDLIYLDIEGYEKFALDGASETIGKFRPVVSIEENGLSERYGVRQGETTNWLVEQFGYKVAAQYGRDIILTP